MNGRLTLAAVLTATLLAACSSPPRDGPGRRLESPDSIPDARPRTEPRSRYGNPESYEVYGKRYRVLDSADGFVERGIASWYGKKFHGRRTSSGEPYDMYAMSAAHKHLPLPTYVEVENLDNGRSVVVRVNDRGPFTDDRIIDLSYAAAAKLDMLDDGTARVEIRAVSPDTAKTEAPDPEPLPEGQVGYYVQIGAFSSRRNARRMADRIEAEGLPAPVRLHPGDDGDGRRLYRVRLGPVPSTRAADGLSARLESAGFADTHVVVSE